MRILDGLKIKYETLSYDDDGEHELSRGAAAQTAEKLGINPAAVYKTIVMRTEKKEVVVFCQSALHEINLKKARTACGAKEVSPVKPDELLARVRTILTTEQDDENIQMSLLPIELYDYSLSVPGKGCKVSYDTLSKFRSVDLPVERDSFASHADRLGSKALSDLLQKEMTLK